MNDLDNLFDDIDEYINDIDDLVSALRGLGITDFEKFQEAMRERGIAVRSIIQKQLAAKFANSEDDDWAEAQRMNTEDSYQHYLDEYQDGKYRKIARECIEKIQKTAEFGTDNDAWNRINRESIDDLQDFIEHFSQSQYYAEASRKLRELRREKYLGVDIRALIKQIKAIRTDTRINDPDRAIYDKIVSYINSQKISVDDLLSAIKNDNNLINGTVANLLYENGIISDFSKTGIDEDFIAHMMSNSATTPFPASNPISRVTKFPCTEVYFWGIPSSGKTCALGAILSCAKSGRVAKSMQQDPNCQGFGYMTRLANLFRTNGTVGTLPPGNAINLTSTFEMGFVLEDEKGKVHPLTFIDLPGELIRCMYKSAAGEFLTEEEKTVLNTMSNILIDNRTQNRKIHYFVIEYGAEDREYEGLPQRDYLEAAVAYIQRTGIFQKDTDGLYLLITKVDKAGAMGREDLVDKLRTYITDNYQGFANGLKSICRNHYINNCEIEIQPFTLGTVCFQSYCKFKDDSAAAVIRTLMKRSFGYKPGKLNKIKNIFKK